MYHMFGARKMIAHKTNGFIKSKYSCYCKHWKFQGQGIQHLNLKSLNSPYSSLRNLSRYSYATSIDLKDRLPIFSIPPTSCLTITRNISVSNVLFESEPLKPSSKVEETIQAFKEKKEAEAKKEVAASVVEADANKKLVVKKSLKQKVIDEIKHYYHGFRLLFIDINVCRKLLMRILNGKTLTRREHNLLIRTTADVFRLIPFSVFIIVPFMEFLLPVFIKFFPGMLPSTFETKTEKEDKLRQSLKVRLEMAKFLQKTLDQMAPQSLEGNTDQAKDFSEFFTKVRTTGEQPTNEDVLKFSRMFQDEITIDSLPRPQLIALCRVLEIYTIGTSNILRFNLRMKIRSLAADDKLINKEGIESLSLSELQQACKARAMRAYGMPEERLRSQLRQWLDLSLNEKIPPILLLMSRALMIPQNLPTTDKLKASISVLPENLIVQQTAAISEKEGIIDNKAKIELIKEEQKKIEEERLERNEEKARLEQETKDKAVDKDKAPVILAETTPELVDPAPIISTAAETPKEEEKKQNITVKDIHIIEGALDSLGKNKKKLLLEKEELADLKEEMADYHEDVQELKNISQSQQVDIKVSKGAKRLAKKVDSIINKLNNVLSTIETEKVKQIEKKELTPDEVDETKKEVVHIEELMGAVKLIADVPDEAKMAHIQHILGRLDDDFDGQLKVDDVYKIIEAIGKDNVHLSDKQLGELVDLLGKEEVIDVENRIQKALVKGLDLKKAVKEAGGSEKIIGESITETSEEKPPSNANENLLKEAEKQEALKVAIEKRKEQLLPKIEPIDVQPETSTEEVKTKDSADAGSKV